MRTRLYLKEIANNTLLAEVQLEVVPRGIYVIDGVSYQYTGQPKFTLSKCENFDVLYDLVLTELIVEPIP